MELGEDFLEAAGEEGSEEESGAEEDEEEEEQLRSRRAMTSQEDHVGPSRKGKRKKEPKGARRSDRTKRRDFSIVWSGLKRCYQLFLGPARFLNVSSTALLARSGGRLLIVA
jgi:histone-lysine N-methyltransferase SUV420H